MKNGHQCGIDKKPAEITYLILAHQRPRQVARLISRLVMNNSKVVLHVDRKVNLATFAGAISRADLPRVHLVTNRISVFWASYSMVEAELELLRAAMKYSPARTYILLSGSDYPIKPEWQLESELEAGNLRLECWDLFSHREGMYRGRLERFKYPASDRLPVIQRCWNEFLSYRLPKRKVEHGLGGRVPFYGSQWWAIGHEHAVFLLNTVKTDTRLVRFYRRSHFPDEGFVQTVMMASPSAGGIKPSINYVCWHRPERNGGSPGIFTKSDLPQLHARPEFFARKFDMDKNPEVLDAIDQWL